MKSTSCPFSIEKLRALLNDFCRRRPIQKLEVFGSVAQGTATEKSDVDLLVTFKSDAQISALEMADMAGEAEEILHNDVDFVERKTIETKANPFKRAAILDSTICLYAA